MLYKPKRIFIEQLVAHKPLTARVLSNCTDVPVEYVPEAETVILSSKYRKLGNSALLLAKQRGPFLRLCPGTPKHICCRYYNLDVTVGCDLDCSYCILQGYLNTPYITVYANTENLYSELGLELSNHPERFYRIGTGELTDSLTFDHITDLTRELVPYFAKQKNAILELKTKSTNIGHLLGLTHNRRVVVSWSLNAESVIACEEKTTPPLSERLDAIAAVQAAGYRLGFHFDPIIDHNEWKQGYRSVIDQLFGIVNPENIAWISLGALRYPPALDDIIRERHPESRIVLGELLPGIDHKLRYFKPIRVEMFHQMHQWIRSHSTQVLIYLCMESDEVWRRSFGWSPKNSVGLAKLLDEQVMDR